MHISFITSHFPFQDSKSVGGIGTSIKNLSDELVYLGHNITVFVYGQDNDEKTIQEGINIVKIKNIKFKGLSWFFTRKKIQQVIKKEHKISRIDILEAPDWEGITSFINLPFPVVIRLHGSDTYFCHLDNRPVKWINKFHEKRALQKADALLSVSQFAADTTNFVFDLSEKFTVIPNPINAALFRSDYENISRENSILYFGSLIRKKGLLELPLIFNKVIDTNPDARLILIGKDVPDIISGNSSTWQMMQNLFSNKAIKNVEYFGSVPYEAIKQKIQEATICVFPSFAEAFPVSWLEAMALEKPIVASNIGWAREVIDEGENGFLVDPKDHSFFAKRIIQFLENESLSIQAGKSARKKVENFFDIKVLAHQNIKYYKEIINSRIKQ